MLCSVVYICFAYALMGSVHLLSSFADIWMFCVEPLVVNICCVDMVMGNGREYVWLKYIRSGGFG